MVERPRRAVLEVVAAGITTGLAGCNTKRGTVGPPDSPTDTEATSVPETEIDTATSTPADTTAPVIEEFTAMSTEQTGRVAVHLVGRDEEEVERVRITTPTDRFTWEPGTSVVDTDERLRAAPGQVNDVSATLEDTAGNAVDETTDTYVRKYDAVEDPAVQIDTVYIPWMGDWIANYIASDEDFSAYSTDPRRHIDQMGYAGITGMLFQYSDRQQRNAFERLSELDMFSNIKLHPYFNGIKWYERNARRRGTEFKDLLDDNLEYVRDNMLRLGNNARIDGRPMITFWDVDFVAWAGNERASRTKEAILDTWGDWEHFVEYLRNTLTVDTRPFLVADVHNNAIHGRYDDLNRHFDGVTNWVGRLQTNEVTSWDDSYESQRRNFEAIREFIEEHGMEFIPTVHPGFYNRHNPNLDDWNHLPRDPSRLGDMLALANEFRTVDRIYVATFNGIREGHQVYPSVFRGKDRRTAYLEVIREYQKGSET